MVSYFQVASSNARLADLAIPFINVFTAGLVVTDFIALFRFRALTQSFTFSAALLKVGRLLLAMAVTTNPLASAPTVAAPMAFAVGLRPFFRWELDRDVLEFLVEPDALEFLEADVRDFIVEPDVLGFINFR